MNLEGRCNRCQNCLHVHRQARRVLSSTRPAGKGVTDDMVQLWNDTLIEFPCLDPVPGQYIVFRRDNAQADDTDMYLDKLGWVADITVATRFPSEQAAEAAATTYLESDRHIQIAIAKLNVSAVGLEALVVVKLLENPGQARHDQLLEALIADGYNSLALMLDVTLTERGVDLANLDVAAAKEALRHNADALWEKYVGPLLTEFEHLLAAHGAGIITPPKDKS